MTPNKIESLIKKELSNRSIIPSENSWDRLNSMLEIGDNKPSKSKTNWRLIAAIFVGFMLLLGTYFNQNNSSKGTQKTVVIQEKTNGNSKISVVKNVIVTTETIKETNINKSKKTENNIQRKDIQINNSPNEHQQEIAEQPIVIEKNIKVDSQTNLSNSIEIKNLPTININSNELLSQADGELELSFREKVIKKATKSFQTVKEALVNRNR